jgi:hypothetical protein
MGRPGLGTLGAMDCQACAYPRGGPALRDGPSGPGGMEEVGEKLTGKVHFAFLHFLHKFEEKFPGQACIRKSRGRRLSIFFNFFVFFVFFVREHRLNVHEPKVCFTPGNEKSPLPPFSKGGNCAAFLRKSPFEKGGFRGI